ncbi:MAG: DUF1795 domain-containing protein [Myxococcaceae bacterium]|nr:DUF1795 domain-containing protein [Myxococcaceae bacterium]
MKSFNYFNLSVPHPEGFSDASQVTLLGPVVKGFRTNVVIVHEAVKRGETAETYAATRLPAIQNAVGFLKVELQTAATFGALLGYWREHTLSLEQRLVTQFQFYCLSKGEMYTFTFSCDPSVAKETRAMAQAFLKGTTFR